MGPPGQAISLRREFWRPLNGLSPLSAAAHAAFKEALIKSTCADLRQKFLLTRKKIAGILTDFKIF